MHKLFRRNRSAGTRRPLDHESKRIERYTQET